MNEQKWIQAITRLQAQCRGYVMWKGLSLVRTQFEETVREIDGGLDHLQWRGNIIPKPHFTDTESLLLQYERSRFQSHDHLENQGSEKSLPPPESRYQRETKLLKQPAEILPHPVDGIVDKRGENVVIQNLMDDSTTLCSTVNSDVSHSSLFQTGPNLHSVFKDTEHTLDSLKQQQSTLAMELLWIQQAISSRKKYFNLKQRMDVPH
ncbi:IQ domain-containing protein C-like [Sinocyclocheilus grahami]|uniref:IQ domain-containing protein C-like n=1 Tax=Sinocyclocheilus grahami TaxID=75366 RepID=UPI0007ACDD02|nr:PREDICTED: IQ domain-containing protein C-like [Sinocyclocheilus grahami]